MIMESKLSLDDYFLRIGFPDKPAVDIETLGKLQELHSQIIAFENLNPLLGLPFKLDMESLQQKLLKDKRGGYCFEQNILFRFVLEKIGFHVKGLIARVIKEGVPEGLITPRTHMLLLVTLNKDLFLVDVGFGGMTPTAPLLLEAREAQVTTLEPYRVVPNAHNYILEVSIQGNWKPLYSFDLEEQFLPDYEVSNWYTSMNSASRFMSDLFVSRTALGSRYILKNNQLSIRDIKKGSEKRLLNTVAELKKTLENIFGLKLPVEKGLDAKLEGLISL